MTVQLITVEVTLQDSILEFQKEIEQELQKYGQGLSWAVVDVNVDRAKAYIDAIVIISTVE